MNKGERNKRIAPLEQHTHIPSERPAVRCPRHPKPSSPAGGRPRHSTSPQESPAHSSRPRFLSLPPAPALALQAPPLPHLGRVAAVSLALKLAEFSRRPGPRPLLRARDEDRVESERCRALSYPANETQRKWDSRGWAVGARLSRCACVTRRRALRTTNYSLRGPNKTKPKTARPAAPGDDGKEQGSASLANLWGRELRDRE